MRTIPRLIAERFHTLSRNESRAIPQGNGMEGIGREWRNMQVVIHPQVEGPDRGSAHTRSAASCRPMNEQRRGGVAMMWAAFDVARIVAAVAFLAVCIFGDSRSPAGIALGTFVVTGLVVSLIRRTAGDER